MRGTDRKTNYVYVSLVVSLTAWLFIFTSYYLVLLIPPVPPLVVIDEPSGELSEIVSSPAPYVNTLAVIGTVATVGVAFFYAFKKFPNVASILAAFLFSAVSFFVYLAYVLAALAFFPSLDNPLTLLLVLLAAILTTLYIRRGRGLSSLIAASLTGSAAGVLLGSAVPLVTGVVLLFAASAFDFAMVKYGYLSALRDEKYSKNVKNIRGLVVEVGELYLGLGDILFYSMTLAVLFFNFGILSALFGNIGLIIGFAATLKLLERHEIVPGLSIPVSIALALGLLIALIF